MAIEQPPEHRTPGIRPRPTLGRQLDAVSRAAFPVVCTVLLMLLAMAPFGFADQAMLLPAITLPCVFFWSLFRPAAMSPPAVFLIGLLLDLLGYLPIGAGVLTLLVLHGFTVRWRRTLARQNFTVVWIAFAGLAAGAAGLLWTLASLLTFRLLPPGPVVFLCVLTTAIYPTVAILFTGAHRSIADPDRA
jgi:rod shape-determining protein MreD